MKTSAADKVLKFGTSLPSPADRLAFALIKRALKALHRDRRTILNIAFGDVVIRAPLEHPSVYWRYRPEKTNRNFLRLAAEVTKLRGGMIVDVGANIGDGVALLRGHGVEAPILAVEGTAEWFKYLTDNTSDMSKVFLEKVFLGEQPGRLSLSVDKSHGTGILVDGNESVEIDTLDHLIRGKGYPDVTFIKTDTDGFDAKVLFGSREILRSKHPVVFTEMAEYLLMQNGDSTRGIFEFMGEMGYTIAAIWDHDGNWMEARSIDRGVDDLVGSYHGKPGSPFLDVAFFAESDRALMSRVAN